MSKFIEYHILQSFPVTCLNRDDVGAPKTAVVGGITRARVSSQCWKRQVRLSLRDLGETVGVRTRHIDSLIAEACLELAEKEAREKGLAWSETEKENLRPSAIACGKKIANVFIKTEKDSSKSAKKTSQQDPSENEEEKKKAADNETLIFLAQTEIERIAKAFQDQGFDSEALITAKQPKDKPNELAKLLGYDKEKDLSKKINVLDIALFGRMVAKVAQMNIEAAASFAHAISTHKVTNEIEFFTALDDSQDEPGSAHMGSLEFNSATYYRYICLDLDQLQQTLGDETDLKPIIATFTKAIFLAVPAARQTTQTGLCPWEFAKVLVRSGQGVQVSFEKPVKWNKEKDRDGHEWNGGYLKPSIAHLKEWLSTKEKQFGSLFGKEGDYEWGEKDYSIDDLIADLQKHV